MVNLCHIASRPAEERLTVIHHESPTDSLAVGCGTGWSSRLVTVMSPNEGQRRWWDQVAARSVVAMERRGWAAGAHALLMIGGLYRRMGRKCFSSAA